MTRFSRTASRAVIATVLVAVLSAGALAASPAVAADSFDDARARWKALLTGGSGFDPAAAPYSAAVTRITDKAQADWDSMIETPTTDLWPGMSTATRVADLYESYIRLKDMTLAYSTHGSPLEASAPLLAAILKGLDWLSAHRYNTSTTRDTNTWYWALGIPMELNDITVMLYSKLGTTRINAYMAAETKFLTGVYKTGPYSTGANRAWSVKVIAVRAMIQESNTKALEARDGLGPVMTYVKTGDGFYERGGFIQHASIPYVGGYGISALELSAEVLYLFATTPWQVVDPVTKNLYDSVSRTFAPFITAGVMMDAVRGREISREYRSDRDAGFATIRAIALLAESATTSVAETLRRTVKRMLLEADVPAYHAEGSITEARLSAALLGDAALSPAADLRGAFPFSSMDRFVHRSASYAFAVSASSSRITNFETANAGENQKAWYTADGMTSLYATDTAQYSPHYWATVNRYRLPGTTVDTRKKGVNDGRNYLSRQNFAGGLASVSGAYGAYGMILDGAQTNLIANKAWFTFDDEIVALGSGIADAGLSGTGWDGAATHIETIVEDRRLDSPGQRLIVDGKTITSATATAFADPTWAQIDGDAGAIGYTFPSAGSLKAATVTNSGRWFDVNAKNGSMDVRTDRYFTMWADHGIAPISAKYAYVVLPGSTLSRTQSYAASPDAVVLVNTSAASAVKETTKNAVGAVFWKDASATVTVGGAAFLTSSGKSVVMTEESSSAMKITVTDPTQARTTPLAIEINRAAKIVVATTPGITVTRLTPTIRFTVNTAGAAGKPFTATFGY